MIWTIIEAGLAIVASSLATIRPLLRAMRIRGFESTQNNTGNSKRSQHRSRLPAHPPIIHYGLDDLALTTDTGILNGENDKSEVYVIKGAANEAASTWSGHSENASLWQIHDLEAQNQENIPSGLGSDSELSTRREVR